VSIDGKRINDAEEEIKISNGMVVKVGKRKFKKIIKKKA
jgi:hypothetical protein